MGRVRTCQNRLSPQGNSTAEVLHCGLQSSNNEGTKTEADNLTVFSLLAPPRAFYLWLSEGEENPWVSEIHSEASKK